VRRCQPCVTASLLPAEEVVRTVGEGLLMRKGDSWPYNWSARLFKLSPGKLERFETKAGGAFKGTLLFSPGACSVRAAAAVNVFIVVCDGKETKLKAASVAERAEWIAAIQQCIGDVEAAEAAAKAAAPW
jgi:hypothetical protein